MLILYGKRIRRRTLNRRSLSWQTGCGMRDNSVYPACALEVKIRAGKSSSTLPEVGHRHAESLPKRAVCTRRLHRGFHCNGDCAISLKTHTSPKLGVPLMMRARQGQRHFVDTWLACIFGSIANPKTT